MRAWPAVVTSGLLACAAQAQQVPDRGYLPALAAPMYAADAGPRVCVDAAHHNFHTIDDRFFAFAALLRRDGYRVLANAAKLDAAALRACDVLVISNAQPSDAEWDTYPYPTPSAFAADEIAAIHRWVERGGALLLIADHMPLAGAASALAARFEVEFIDGFAQRESGEGVDLFSRSAGTLKDHAIVRGRNATETVESIRTFTGQGFRAPKAGALLVLPDDFVVLMPRIAWEFAADTPKMPGKGLLQGAALEVGDGRAAFFGEAAMFSAQLAGPDKAPMGMNARGAERNHQFVLNVMHWLTRKL